MRAETGGLRAANRNTRTAATAHSALTSLWLFFAAAFCWSWTSWILAAVLGANVETTLGLALLRLGLLGPMLAGIAFTYLSEGKAGHREYWLRVVDPRRISLRWCAVIVLLVPALMTIAALLAIASGDDQVPTEIGKRATALVEAPSILAVFLVATLINGPLPEELGWRGYALDRLQHRWNALTSSLILGGIWALWHLPLFFIRGMRHYVEGVGSPWFWLFMAGIVPSAVVFTWIFNNTRRSTLGAIAFHFTANVTYEIGNVDDRTNLCATLMWFVAAGVVAVLWRAEARRSDGVMPAER